MKINYPTEKEIDTSIEEILEECFPVKKKGVRKIRFTVTVAASLLIVFGITMLLSVFPGDKTDYSFSISVGAKSIPRNFDEIYAVDVSGCMYYNSEIKACVDIKDFNIHTYGKNIETVTYKMEDGCYFAIADDVKVLAKVKEDKFDKKYFSSENNVYSSYTVDFDDQFKFIENDNVDGGQSPVCLCITTEGINNKKLQDAIDKIKTLVNDYNSLSISNKKKNKDRFLTSLNVANQEINNNMPKYVKGYATARFTDGTTQTKEFKVKLEG